MSRVSSFGNDFLSGPSASDREKRAREARELAKKGAEGFQKRQPTGEAETPPAPAPEASEPAPAPKAPAEAKNTPATKPAAKRKPGRPKGSTKPKTAQFNFHLREDLKEKLDDVIDEELGGAKSAYMTKLVRQHLIDIGKLEE